MVTRQGNLSLYDLVYHSCDKIHLDNVDITLIYFEGVVDYSTTLIRVYSGALTHSLVPLELNYVDHTTTTTFVIIKIAKVDLTHMQRVLPYQHVEQFIQLPPIWLGELVELTSAY